MAAVCLSAALLALPPLPRALLSPLPPPPAKFPRAIRMCAPRAPEAATALLEENERLQARVAALEEQLGRTEGLCEVLDSGADFNDSLRSRAAWLLGLLVAQSASSFILEGAEELIHSHPVIVYFMTMLVGAGGNAGNQAAVRIIRGLATGEVNPSSERAFIASEVRMAGCLSLLVVAAGFLRVVAFDATPVDALAISLALFLIVGISVVLGTLLPLLLHRLRLDAAHASTSIQVVMDVLGVTIACLVTPVVYSMAASGAFALPALAAEWLPAELLR
ncbi:hypothetical protein AB1Y20_012370 [Prymnesium parvum]|uniref:SLC41A/MgtE integral membrane domain-containing protein n=1 Tax=Prymnesium parvum TaxID=97485 RepID=A0AB34IP64_PRYPA